MPSAWVLVLCEVSLSTWNSKCPEVPGGRVQKAKSGTERAPSRDADGVRGGWTRVRAVRLNQQCGRRGSPAGRWRGCLQSGAWRIRAQERAGRPRPWAWATRPLKAAFMASVPACVPTSLFYSPTLLEIMILSPSSSF